MGLVALFFFLPHFVSGDGYQRFRALGRLVNAGKLSAMGHSMVGPLFALPLWPLGYLYQSPEWWLARFNFFVFAVGLYFFNRLLRDQIEPRVVRRFLLILIGGSMFPHYLQDFYGEVFTAILVGVSVLAIQLKRPRYGWTGLVLGSLNTPASLLGLSGVAIAESAAARRWRFLVVPALTVGLLALDAWVRRGSPFTTGYETDGGTATVLTYSGRPGFSYPLFFGLLSLLLAFGKGLIFFAPGLLLLGHGAVRSLKREIRTSHDRWLLFLLGLVLAYSKWWAWYGGWTWGPRFLLLGSIPASFALAVALARPSGSLGGSAGLLIILSLSFWVGACGAVFGFAGLEDCRDAALEHLCWYVPEFSALWRPFVTGAPVQTSQIILLVYLGLVFVYLAFPVVSALWSSSTKELTRLLELHRRGPEWRF